MLNISVDQDTVKTIYLEEVRKSVKAMEHQMLLIDTKELCKMLSLSRPTVEKLFISNPEFPTLRIGKKYLFNRKEVEEYIKRWSITLKKNGGKIECD
ncbi:helix-turn-helix domain-containing protein [Bacillus sp. AK031]